MKLYFKKIDEGRFPPDNSLSINYESNMIDLRIEKRNQLVDLIENNYNNRKYCEEVFNIFDIVFDEDYDDVITFMNSKKGIVRTNIPYHYKRIQLTENVIEYVDTTFYMSYLVSHYDIDLNHVYSYEELEKLIKEGKVVLLESTPSTKTLFDCKIVGDRKPLPTLEDYDFANIDNNGISNNNVVLGMVRSETDTPILRKKLIEYDAVLLTHLKSLRTQALNMSQSLKEKIKEHERFANICEEKIKKMSEFKQR